MSTRAAEGDVKESDESAESAEGSVNEPPEATGSSRRWSLRTPWTVTALAAVLMVAAVLVWWRADHDDSLALAATRDAVVIAATSDIETMNSLDYRDTAAGLAAWGKVTTGTLHDQITDVSGEDKDLLADQAKISVGKVVDLAVTSLDPTKASVIASVEVTVADGEDQTKEPTVKRNRFSADLVLVRGHWLLERLDQVAVSVS